MGVKKSIYFTVTNDLNYDQRMQRICGTLAQAGYEVVLIGRTMPGSLALAPQLFGQKRLLLLFRKGKAFYIEYNLRLFLYLLFKKMDGICAIDLDTILPCLYISRLKRIPRIYDAHELFTELKEVVSRPAIFKFWNWVERKAVPSFATGYSVNQFIVNELEKRYAVKYNVIRNLPVWQSVIDTEKEERLDEKFLAQVPAGRFFLYQGAVNEGRSFETLIPAMKDVIIPLVIAGDGNFMATVKNLVKTHGLEKKVICLGLVPPGQLRLLTPMAFYGLTLFENAGMNQYYSLANRFFDYIQGGIPQLCVDYPEYRAINEQYQVAVLTGDLSPASLSTTLNKLTTDDVTYSQLRANCIPASKQLCWEMEKQKLIGIYNKIF